MKLKRFIKNNFTKVTYALFSVLLLSVIIFIISLLSSGFADFYTQYIGGSIRIVLSKITGILPFSLGETIFLCVPLFIVAVIVRLNYVTNHQPENYGRFLIHLISVVLVMASLFLLSFAPAYKCTSLDLRLGLNKDDVDVQTLENTAMILNSEIEKATEGIEYKANGASVMPYDYSELNVKLNNAYDTVCEKYAFIQNFQSDVKLLAVSPVMTYTHISGFYAYYTGEANLNFNYPDYTAPYTMAHEMAHQRGFAREDEANFIAFLVCINSDDDYIKYSGYQSILEYVLDAYYTADRDGYWNLISQINLKSRSEMTSFSEFFEKYENSGAAKVSNAVNDTVLKASGQKAGARSYGLVVDLACAYYK